MIVAVFERKKFQSVKKPCVTVQILSFNRTPVNPKCLFKGGGFAGIPSDSWGRVLLNQ